MVVSRGAARQPPGYCWQLFTSEARKHHGSQSAPKLLAYLIGRAGGPPPQAGGPSADDQAPDASVGGNGALPHVSPPDEGTQLRCVCRPLCAVLDVCFLSAVPQRGRGALSSAQRSRGLLPSQHQPGSAAVSCHTVHVPGFGVVRRRTIRQSLEQTLWKC